MKTRRWGLIFLSILCCVLVLSGCFSGFFVKVNGVKLSVSDLNKKYAAAETVYKPELEKQGYEFDDASKQELKSLIAYYMIMQEIIRADCKVNKWDINVPEVQKDIQDYKEREGTVAFQKFLDRSGMTEKQLLQNLAHYYYVTKDVAVTEDDVRQFYLNNFNNPNFRDFAESVTARHILVATEAEALDILNRLKAGEGFAALVQEKTLDEASKSTNGVYTFGRNEMTPEFEEAAFTLNPGEISQPVKTDYGYHIIEVTEHKAAATSEDYDKYRSQLGSTLDEYALQTAQEAKYEAAKRQLEDKASMEFAAGYEYLNPETTAETTPETGD